MELIGGGDSVERSAIFAVGRNEKLLRMASNFFFL